MVVGWVLSSRAAHLEDPELSEKGVWWAFFIVLHNIQKVRVSAQKSEKTGREPSGVGIWAR